MKDSAISGSARICGVIGDPIAHTMSPVMHNAAFEQMGLDCLYVPLRVKREELATAIAGMKALNIRGLNITIPHKVAIIPFLDEVDPLAERIGAINTVVNDDGYLTGYNTDATGFLQALLAGGAEPEGKRVVILGAGGASRAISFILADRGAHLAIVNRTADFDLAEKLAYRIYQHFGREVEALELNQENLKKALEGADIVVNATSVGMSPSVDETPVPARLLRPGLLLFDIVYNPLKTKLLAEAEAAGVETINGLDMFVWQGALAFEIWTGLKPPLELMKEVTMKVLR